MSPRRRIPGPVLDRIRFLKLEHPDWTPSQVLQAVDAETPKAVSYRTVQRLVASFRPAEPGTAWDFWTSDPDDAALLVPIRRALLERRGSDRWPAMPTQLTTAEAEYVVRIRRTFPDFDDPRAVFTIAWLASGTSGGWRDPIEEWLVFTPWRDGGAALAAAVESDRISSTAQLLAKTITSMWEAPDIHETLRAARAAREVEDALELRTRPRMRDSTRLEAPDER
jgi:hypothetical protein